ncbi:MAG: ABC-2 family transporter protein [Clostridia bacterium]|nr:ABC-2 family transporter protein [Clostridia bacterium]
MKLNAYFSAFRMRWKMEWQYRGAAIGGLLCQMFFGLILVALYRVLYAGAPQDRPLASVVTYVWLQQAFFRMLTAADSDLTDKIRTGDIAYDLCRPLHLYGYYYVRVMAQKMLGSLMRGVPMLTIAALLPAGWGMAAPASPGGLVLALLGLGLGLLCMCAIENITVGLTMRTLDPKGIQAMLNLLMMILAGNILPLTLFPDRWQRVITLLPYAQMLDAPIRLYTGEWALTQAPRVLLTQAVWAVILAALGMSLWRQNQKRLIVQGG